MADRATESPLRAGILARARVLSPPSAALVIGAVVLCGLAALFAYVLDSVREGEGIAAVDRLAVAWLADHRQPVLTAVMRGVSIVGSPVSAGAVAIVVCAVVAWRVHRWLPVLIAVLGIAGFALADTVVKLVVHRQRPPLPYAVVAADGYSFPSGHAMGITTAALLSAWALDHWIIRSTRTRIATWTTAVIIIAVVGFSRIYLGVHYPSDVIAGWLLGLIWVGVLIIMVGLYEQTHQHAMSN